MKVGISVNSDGALGAEEALTHDKPSDFVFQQTNQRDVAGEVLSVWRQSDANNVVPTSGAPPALGKAMLGKVMLVCR